MLLTAFCNTGPVLFLILSHVRNFNRLETLTKNGIPFTNMMSAAIATSRWSSIRLCGIRT